jgi:hypothetical protein
VTRRLASHVLGGALLFALTATFVPACSLGAGTGSAIGVLDVPDCWVGTFNLQPDFFAGDPYMTSSYLIRVQRGSDYEEFSDGISFLVDDVNPIRDPTNGELRQKLEVSLSPAVTPPGVPVVATANPAVVHSTLYMNQTCRIQNVALYALDAVTLGANGECSGDASDGGEATTSPTCNGGNGLLDGGMSNATPDGGTSDATVDGGATPSANTIGQSWILFRSLADANPDEANAADRLTDADFELYLADPREICPGGLGPPPPCRGHVTGSFKFYFDRGRPAQAFP